MSSVRSRQRVLSLKNNYSTVESYRYCREDLSRSSTGIAIPEFSLGNRVGSYLIGLPLCWPEWSTQPRGAPTKFDGRQAVRRSRKPRFTILVSVGYAALMHRPRISCLFLLFLLSLILPFVAVAATKSPIQERADRFLALANSGYQALFRVNSEAQWLAVTDVTPAYDAAAAAPDSRSQWFIFAAAFMISACTTGIMSAM